MENKIEISVVIPVYKCSESIPELTERLCKVLPKITNDFEIIFVNDGSPENDWYFVKKECEKDSRIVGVNLTRNFGQHQAITAGLTYANGSWIIVMDGDLQDNPDQIKELYSELQPRDHIIFARRLGRNDSLFRILSSKLFYFVLEYFTDHQFDPSVSNFGIFSKQVVSEYLRMKEHYRAFPVLVRWLGFPIKYKEVPHSERIYGRSSYSFSKLVDLAMDIIIAQSNKPLKVSIKSGFILSAFSFGFLLWLAIRKLFFSVPLGWTSLMVAIFFVGGVLLLSLGIIGLYVGKIYDETKERPLFVIKEVVKSQSFIKD